MIEIKHIRKRDYKRAQQFAIQGMHLNWYMDSGLILNLYSKYFWHMELNRATKVYGAYVEDAFVGVLLADMRNEPKRYHRWWRTAFVGIFNILQHIFAGQGIDTYDMANQDMLSSFCKRNTSDGEIVFLAADPNSPIKGVGTALLAAFEADEKGKQIYLYTDDACTYQFYEHRGFKREEERDTVIAVGGRQVPLKCLLYAKRIPE